MQTSHGIELKIRDAEANESGDSSAKDCCTGMPDIHVLNVIGKYRNLEDQWVVIFLSRTQLNRILFIGV